MNKVDRYIKAIRRANRHLTANGGWVYTERGTSLAYMLTAEGSLVMEEYDIDADTEQPCERLSHIDIPIDALKELYAWMHANFAEDK